MRARDAVGSASYSFPLPDHQAEAEPDPVGLVGPLVLGARLVDGGRVRPARRCSSASPPVAVAGPPLALPPLALPAFAFASPVSIAAALASEIPGPPTESFSASVAALGAGVVVATDGVRAAAVAARRRRTWHWRCRRCRRSPASPPATIVAASPLVADSAVRGAGRAGVGRGRVTGRSTVSAGARCRRRRRGRIASGSTRRAARRGGRATVAAVAVRDAVPTPAAGPGTAGRAGSAGHQCCSSQLAPEVAGGVAVAVRVAAGSAGRRAGRGRGTRIVPACRLLRLGVAAARAAARGRVSAFGLGFGPGRSQAVAAVGVSGVTLVLVLDASGPASNRAALELEQPAPHDAAPPLPPLPPSALPPADVRGGRRVPARVSVRARVAAGAGARVSAVCICRLIRGAAVRRSCRASDCAGVGSSAGGDTSVSRSTATATCLGVRTGRTCCDATLMHRGDLHVHLGSDVRLESAWIRHLGQCASRNGQRHGSCACDQELP